MGPRDPRPKCFNTEKDASVVLGDKDEKIQPEKQIDMITYVYIDIIVRTSCRVGECRSKI